MKKLQFCLVLLSLLVFSISMTAQIQNGQVQGTVTDPQGAAIANAKVTVTNPGTNYSITVTTNSTGNYTAKELPVGSYKITVEAQGFKTVSNTNVPVNAGTIAHVDVKMQLGEAREVVEVTGEVAAVNTEDSKLAATVSAQQISNLPLNGRNVFDLIQIAPGAVNVTGVDFENGHNTVVNGLREDFNGFLINGVSNKGLSGGVVNTPIQDTVEEFQQLQLNVSAQYGNSAGSTTNLVTKSGTNSFHGSAWEYIRNDKLDANEFFLNQSGTAKPALRFNQFGFTLGGPIIKDKLFFFGSYQGDRFTTVGTPQTVTQETAEWRQAVLAADQANGVNSVAGLLYQNFAPFVQGVPGTQVSLDQYTGGDYSFYLCPDNNSPAIAARMASILGVTAADQAVMTAGGCSSIPGLQTGTVDRSAPFLEDSVALFKRQQQDLGNLFNGNEASLRIDYNWNASNRLFTQFNWFKSTDKFGPCSDHCTRGFSNPLISRLPNGMFSYVHTFTPTILNEFRAGYAQNTALISTNIPGVPDINFDDGSLGFGSYNGYPQFFKEHIYTYSDMVSISHGNHNIKVGADLRRNIENSEFNVARPSYYFFDQIYFAADAPYEMVAGVNPDICTAPCTSFNSSPNAFLESNVRHWRNWEIGAYFQDDWKVTKRLTLNLGIRYDLYQRHHELDNKATTFLLGPGSNVIEGVKNANVLAGTVGTIGGTTFDCTSNTAIALSTLAGICGPGGFAPAKQLGAGDHNNWGPRVGFAWDVFGDGKTSLRGGFSVAYEGTLYNPLSNSRWNLPYYSFNDASNFLIGDTNGVIYGPTTCTGSGLSTVCSPSGGAQFGPGGVAPAFTGAGTNPGQGTGAQSAGNITGWDAANPNLAILTGVVLPEGIKDPYVYNYFLSVQREILPKWTVEVDYVGTAGHKLFRAESINREPGTRLPAGLTLTDNFGRTWTGTGSRLNNNYGTIRNWRNNVSSNYNSLQASLKHQMGHGLLFNANYTWSHSIDNGSTWHSGATTANGAAGGEGFSSDVTLPGLDRGNSVFDIRHRLVLNYVWELPGQNLKGIAGAVLGGWTYSGVWSFQTGAHWQPYDARARALTGDCSQAGIDAGLCINTGGDYNLDRASNERPNSSLSSFSSQSRAEWATGWCAPGTGVSPNNYTCQSTSTVPVFSTPCLGCVGNLGRNTFVGPGNWAADMTLAKTFKFTERFRLKFEAAGFNVFNRANFLLATAGGGAHNKVADTRFGKAAGTLNPRQLQFGLKLSF